MKAFSQSERPQHPQTPACAARRPSCCRTEPSGCHHGAPGPAPPTGAEQRFAPSMRCSPLIGSWPATLARMLSGWTGKQSSHLQGGDLAGAARIEWWRAEGTWGWLCSPSNPSWSEERGGSLSAVRWADYFRWPDGQKDRDGREKSHRFIINQRDEDKNVLDIIPPFLQSCAK